MDEQGTFHVRQRRRPGAEQSGSQEVTQSTSVSEFGGLGPTSLMSSSEGVIGTTSLMSSSGGVAGATSLPSSSSGGTNTTSSQVSSSLPRPTTIPEEPMEVSEEGGETTLEHPGSQGVAPGRSNKMSSTQVEDPPMRFEIFYTQYGEVYHKSRHCGKLRCAKRILSADNCTACANRVLRGERVSMDRLSYHILGQSCGTAVVNVLRACAECGH